VYHPLIQVEMKTAPSDSTSKFPGIMRQPEYLGIILIILLTFLAYFNGLNCPLVFDDPMIIQDFRAKTPAEILLQSGHRPIFNLTLGLNLLIHHLGLWSYHLFNLLLHIIAALLLLGILRRLFEKHLFPEKPVTAAWLGFAGAAIWALHPLQTESVTYLSQRGEVMIGMFAFLTLYCLIRSCKAPPKNRLYWQLGALASLLCGFGSKEAMISLPFLIPLFDRCFLSRSWRESWEERKIFYGSLLISAAGILLFLFIKIGVWTFFSQTYKFTAWQYFLTQTEVIRHYLYLSFLPNPDLLCFDYAWPIQNSFTAVWASFLFLSGLFILTGWACWKYPRIGFLGAWFFIWLAPRSSLMPRPDAAVEHRMYLPLAAISILAVIAGYQLLAKLIASIGRLKDQAKIELLPQAGKILLIIVLALLLFGTITRNRIYQSEFSLWEDTVRKRPQNDRALNYLGICLVEMNRLPEAEFCFRRSIALKPANPLAMNNLAKCLTDQQKYAEALTILTEVQQSIKPDEDNQLRRDARAQIACNIAEIMVRQGQDQAAWIQLKEAAHLAPHKPEVNIIIGTAFLGKGKTDRAKRHFAHALVHAVDPDLTRAQILEIYRAHQLPPPAGRVFPGPGRGMPGTIKAASSSFPNSAPCNCVPYCCPCAISAISLRVS